MTFGRFFKIKKVFWVFWVYVFCAISCGAFATLYNSGALFQAKNTGHPLECADILDKEWPALSDPRMEQLLVASFALCALERASQPLSFYGKSFLSALLASLSFRNLSGEKTGNWDNSSHFNSQTKQAFGALLQEKKPCWDVEHGLSCVDLLSATIPMNHTPQLSNLRDYARSLCFSVRILQRDLDPQFYAHLPIVKILTRDLLSILSFVLRPENDQKFGQYYLREQEAYEERLRTRG